jgi:hypothetical protein
MRDYRKPSKAQANEAYLKSLGVEKDDNPYKEETVDKNKLFLWFSRGKIQSLAILRAFPCPPK